MATIYATVEEVGAYLLLSDAGLELPDDEDTAEALVERAELDVDRLLDPALERDPLTGRKLDPVLFTLPQQAALARAVGAQAEFRLAVEEAELVGDDTTERIASISFGPTPRPPGPKAVEELSGFGFPWRSGTVAPDPEPEVEEV
jgi:hypothetical protein